MNTLLYILLAVSILDKIETSNYRKREYYQLQLSAIPFNELLMVKYSKKLSTEQLHRVNIVLEKHLLNYDISIAYKLADDIYDYWIQNPQTDDNPFFPLYDYETYQFLTLVEDTRLLPYAAYRLEQLAFRDRKIKSKPLKDKVNVSYSDLKNYIWHLEIQTRK